MKATLNYDFKPQEKTFMEWMLRIKSEHYHKIDGKIVKNKTR